MASQTENSPESASSTKDSQLQRIRLPTVTSHQGADSADLRSSGKLTDRVFTRGIIRGQPVGQKAFLFTVGQV
jgi:hypothetical protein